MSLRPEETEIIGSWRMIDGRPVEDEASRRIRTLTKRWLKLIASSSDGWERLYEDPQDHRLWELTYPTSETHSGGAPTLRAVEREAARRKYKLESN
jgi:Immunity protein 27